MDIIFLIASLCFDFFVSFFVGLLVWIIFRRRLSLVAACVVIGLTCALLTAVAWPLARASGWEGAVGLVANLLLAPFSIAWFSGGIPSVPVALFFQIVSMAVVGVLVWRRENQRTKNQPNNKQDPRPHRL